MLEGGIRWEKARDLRTVSSRSFSWLQVAWSPNHCFNCASMASTSIFRRSSSLFCVGNADGLLSTVVEYGWPRRRGARSLTQGMAASLGKLGVPAVETRRATLQNLIANMMRQTVE